MLKTKVRKERRGKCRKIINSTARIIKGLHLTLYITTVDSLMFAQNVSKPPFPKNHLFSCTKTNEVSLAISLQCFPLQAASSGAGGQLTSRGKGTSGTLACVGCVAVRVRCCTAPCCSKQAKAALENCCCRKLVQVIVARGPGASRCLSGLISTKLMHISEKHSKTCCSSTGSLGCH